MTAQGTPLTRFRRAIDNRSVMLAELAAREAGWLPLEEALALLELYARLGEQKFEPAAVRWLGRLVTSYDRRSPTFTSLRVRSLCCRSGRSRRCRRCRN